MAGNSVSKKSSNVEMFLTVPPVSSETLTIEEIAEWCGLHRDTVRKLIKAGTFPNAYRDSKSKNRRWRVPTIDLEGFSPRKRGRKKIADPTPGTILWRGKWAKKQIKYSHNYGKKEVNEIIDLANEGCQSDEIAARYRLSENIVADLLAAANQRKPRAKKKLSATRLPKRLPEKELIELYVNGEFPTAYILEKLKTNYASLYINLRHYGIPLRDKRLRAATEENETRLYRLAFEDKLPLQTIAARLKLTESYVRRKINEIKRRLVLTEISDSSS